MSLEDEVKRFDQQTASCDTENAHIRADELLIQFLIDIGYKELADSFCKVPAWYA